MPLLHRHVLLGLWQRVVFSQDMRRKKSMVFRLAKESQRTGVSGRRGKAAVDKRLPKVRVYLNHGVGGVLGYPPMQADLPAPVPLVIVKLDLARGDAPSPAGARGGLPGNAQRRVNNVGLVTSVHHAEADLHRVVPLEELPRQQQFQDVPQPGQDSTFLGRAGVHFAQRVAYSGLGEISPLVWPSAIVNHRAREVGLPSANQPGQVVVAGINEGCEADSLLRNCSSLIPVGFLHDLVGRGQPAKGFRL